MLWLAEGRAGKQLPRLGVNARDWVLVGWAEGLALTLTEVVEEVVGTVSSTEAARLAGITYRQLDWWARQSIFVPECAASIGSGHHRSYTLHEVRTLKLLGELSRLGCPLSTLSIVGDSIRSIDEDESDKQWLLIRPDGAVAFCSSEELARTVALTANVTGLIINVEKVLSTS